MKSVKIISLFLGLSMIWMAFEIEKPSSKLVKAFDALRIYNYFEAKDLFYKSLKKDSVASSYGLSVIYGRNDNPFYALDSSFKYINLAIRLEPYLDDKKRLDIASLGVDSTSLSKQLLFVDSCFFNLALSADSLASWTDFIVLHHSQPYLTKAIERRNELAYEETEAINTSAAYSHFMELYPEALQFNDAEKNFKRRLFEEFVGSGDLQAYRDFISQYPDSPHREEAENIVFEISTESQTVESYSLFIEENPENPNVERAWHKIYAMEISELNALNIAAFSLKYPNYPFAEELKAEFEAAVTRYYPIEDNQLWGFVDEKGVVKIPCQYQWVEPFSENLAAVGTKDEVLFINKSGTVVIQDGLEDAYSFKSGYVVAMREDKMGIINRFGEWIAEPIYEDLGEYSEGYFYASLDGKYGYLNESGKTTIDFKYEDATDFHRGLAVVEADSGIGIINVTDSSVSTFKYDWIEPFSHSVPVVRCRIDDKFGLIDTLGNELVAPQYDHIGDWAEGLALAEVDDIYGFINAKGDTIVDFTYTYSTEAFKNSFFNNGFAKVYQSKKVGIIDTLGKKIFPAMFQDVGLIEGSLVPVNKNGKWGYSNLNVDLVLPYRYAEAHSFIDSLAIVKIGEQYGVIDTLGNEILAIKFTSLERIGKLWLASDTALGIININGDTIVPFLYQKAEVMDSKVIRLYDQDEGFSYFDYVRQKFIWKPDDN